MLNLSVQARTSTIRKRVLLNSACTLAAWVLGVLLVWLRAPFWSVLLVGAVGGYFTFRDWRLVRTMARAAVDPPHPDPDVQALIDGDMSISEYRRRKEEGNAE